MKDNKRLLSLDVLRGLTVAGMILVNNAGACGYCYAPLRHVSWNGFTPADLVFPMFMYMMGISTYISLRKTNFNWHLSLGKILRRSILVIIIGLAMAWLISSCSTGDWSDFAHLRLMGVMQRLGICYGITALLALFVSHQRFWGIAIGLLVFYFLLQLFGDGFEKSPENIVSRVDVAILGTDHMYLQGKQFVDPEGILSTIPAVAQVMIGFVCGRMLVQIKDNDQRIQKLFLIGTAMLFSGFLLNYADPINKRLWSPSFVLITCGIAALSLAALIYIIDVRHNKHWSVFFQVFGINPLILYVFGEVFGDLFRIWGVNKALFQPFLQPLLGDYFGSFTYAALFLLLTWLLGYLLFKKQIYIKL